MANYFNFFPSTLYYAGANNSTSLDIVTNIIARFAFEGSLKENSSAFYPYEIKDTDTPESIAFKIYGDSEKHWIVLLFNNIIDPQFDWPLSYREFIKYVNSKYSTNGAANTTPQTGVAWAQSTNNVKAYFKIVTRSGTTDKSPVTITEKIQVDANTYANVIVTTNNVTLNSGTIVAETTTKEKQTYYDYEMDLNENKRSIKLLKPEFASAAFAEFKQIVS